MRGFFTTLAIMALCSLGVMALPDTEAKARQAISPSPELTAEDVVAIQLRALKHNNTPSRDAGIAQVWEFAHPDNKRLTGPLPRFAQMIRSASYAILLGHRSHTISKAPAPGNGAAFYVDVVGQSGVAVRYLWVLAKAYGGDLNGSWMTVTVTIPRQDGLKI